MTNSLIKILHIFTLIWALLGTLIVIILGIFFSDILQQNVALLLSFGLILPGILNLLVNLCSSCANCKAPAIYNRRKKAPFVKQSRFYCKNCGSKWHIN